MASFIEYAVPTDKEAVDYLEDNDRSITVTPAEAKNLFPDFITDYKNFKCPHCSAPISCRAIYSYSRTGPAFIDQVSKPTLHKSDCEYHPDNRTASAADYHGSDGTRTFISDGSYVTDLTPNGFISRTTPDQKIVNSSGQVSSSNYYRSEENVGNETNDKKDKEVNLHLSTLEDHVKYYLDDEDFTVFAKTSGKEIPIKFLFKKIQSNLSVMDLKPHRYLNIYMGYAFINKTSNDDIWSVRFADEVTVSGITAKPSFAVKKDYIKANFQDIYDAFLNNETKVFSVYTTLPFVLKKFKDKTYINFASFRNGEPIKPWADELLDNFFIV